MKPIMGTEFQKAQGDKNCQVPQSNRGGWQQKTRTSDSEL